MRARTGSRMRVTRTSNRRRPSTSRSHDVSPSRSTRSSGSRLRSASHWSTSWAVADVTRRSIWDMNRVYRRRYRPRNWTARGGACRHPKPLAREPRALRSCLDSGRYRFLSFAIRRHHWDRSRERRPPDALATLHRRAVFHDPCRKIGRPNVPADLHVAPDPSRARDHRPLAYDRQPGEEAARFLSVGRREIVALTHDRTRTDHDLLVEDRPIHDRPGSDHRVEHDDRVAHYRTNVDPNAGRQDGVDDRPVDDATVADEAAVDLRRRADLRRRPFLGPRMDEPFLVVEVELGDVVEEGHVGLPVRL